MAHNNLGLMDHHGYGVARGTDGIALCAVTTGQVRAARAAQLSFSPATAANRTLIR